MFLRSRHATLQCFHEAHLKPITLLCSSICFSPIFKYQSNFLSWACHSSMLQSKVWTFNMKMLIVLNDISLIKLQGKAELAYLATQQ